VRQFAAAYPRFQAAGVEIVRVFPSPLSALDRYASGGLKAPFPVLADPERHAYDAFRVERGWRCLFSREGWRRSFAASRQVEGPRWRDMIRDGIRGFPADFLIGEDGRILHAHYAAHFADGLTIPEALALAEAPSNGGGLSRRAGGARRPDSPE